MSENRPRLTKRQRETLDYINSYNNENGFGPSLRDIQRAFELGSVSTAALHVDGLVAGGYLRKQRKSARSLQVISTDMETPSPEVDSDHLEWLRREIAKREANPDLSREAELLKAALELLDQSDKK